MTYMDIKSTYRPAGLVVLGGLQVYVALRAIWNFLFLAEGISHFSMAVLCGIIGLGIINLKKWAYRAFIAVYVILILWNLGDAIAGKSLAGQAPQVYGMKSLQRAIAAIVYLGWIFYYRRYFRNNSKGDVAIG